MRKNGEEIGENQEIQKDKEGECVKNHTSHIVFSQKDARISMEEKTLLSIPSQKGLDIDNSSHPGAHNIEEATQDK